MQGVYAPLSQYLSDSDSEKDIIMEQVFSTSWHPNSTLTNFNNVNNMMPSEEYQMNNNINQKVKNKRVRFAMSNSRKAAFITSIIFCFLPVILFLWVLPCNNNAICAVKVSNWKMAQKFVEFIGNINLIEGQFQEQNLALMYKGSFNDLRVLKNGVLAFRGRSGSVLWNYQQNSCPLKMKCDLVDIDQDGFKDCLILDDTGLKTLNTLSGTLIWHFHSVHKKIANGADLVFPVLLNDFNEDGYTDLLWLIKKEVFLVISGQTGSALCSFKVSSCLFIETLMVIQDSIQFLCTFVNHTKVHYQILFNDINMKCKYPNMEIPLTYVDVEIPKEDSTVFHSGTKTLFVSVDGQCPHCQSLVLLNKDNETGIESARKWLYQNAFVSTPIPFYLNYTADSSIKGHINGFIFKVWHWQKDAQLLSTSTRVHQRKLPNDSKSYRLYTIIENVVLLSFYQHNPHNINVSMNEIYVICKGKDLKNCQPDYRNWANPLQIADLDGDNSLELIRYHSSYEKDEESDYENWELNSKLTVFRLAEELPKLYKNKSSTLSK